MKITSSLGSTHGPNPTNKAKMMNSSSLKLWFMLFAVKGKSWDYQKLLWITKLIMAHVEFQIYKNKMIRFFFLISLLQELGMRAY